jgi:16S rRNA (adenine(1408)-N(1))-methyltransferase
VQIISGKTTSAMTAPELAAWAAPYQATLLDLGTGDGRFVQHLARGHPELAVIGVDLNAANLRRASRTATGNALFAVADALALPDALTGTATRVTINFPWGSLLHGLLAGDPALIAGLRRVASGAATLDIRVNAGALAEAGVTVEDGSRRLTAVLRESGCSVRDARLLGATDLRCWPTTWAKRLAFGQDPRAIQISAALNASPRRSHDVAGGTRSIQFPSPVGIAAALG